MEVKSVPQWKPSKEIADWLTKKREMHGTTTAYIRSLIMADMKKKR